MKSGTSQQRRVRFRAMTLIEVLAVICLIALAAALTLSGLGAASTAAQLRTALAECRQLDARARLLVRAEGPMVITMTDDRDMLHAVLHSGMVETAPPLLRAAAPVDWSVHLLDAEGNELSSLHVDARGHSNDYLLELRPHEAFDGTPVARRLKVAGLTGWIEEIAEP